MEADRTDHGPPQLRMDRRSGKRTFAGFVAGNSPDGSFASPMDSQIGVRRYWSTNHLAALAGAQPDLPAAASGPYLHFGSPERTHGSWAAGTRAVWGSLHPRL